MSYMEYQQKKPHLIILVGIPGSGKSFFAENFAKSFKSPIINSETIRSQLSKKPTYSNDEDAIVKNLTLLFLGEALKTNRTVIYRGKTDTKANRSTITKMCRDMGYDTFLVWVQTDIESSKKRYLKCIGDNSTKAIDRFDNLVKKFEPPRSNEKPIVISGKHDYESQLKIVLNNIVKRCPSPDPTDLHDRHFGGLRHLIR